MSVLDLTFNITVNGAARDNNIPVSTNYMFFAVGDFSGGCLSLETSPNNGADWFTVDQLTGPGRLIRYLVDGERVRLSMVGATSPNISAGIRQ